MSPSPPGLRRRGPHAAELPVRARGGDEGHAAPATGRGGRALVHVLHHADDPEPPIARPAPADRIGCTPQPGDRLRRAVRTVPSERRSAAAISTASRSTSFGRAATTFVYRWRASDGTRRPRFVRGRPRRFRSRLPKNGAWSRFASDGLRRARFRAEGSSGGSIREASCCTVSPSSRWCSGFVMRMCLRHLATGSVGAGRVGPGAGPARARWPAGLGGAGRGGDARRPRSPPGRRPHRLDHAGPPARSPTSTASRSGISAAGNGWLERLGWRIHAPTMILS